MGRPSKLTPAQWADVERRILAGESARALGKEFGVSEGAIRQRFGTTTRVSTQSAQVRETAQKIAEADLALQGLPASQRAVAMDLADTYRNTLVSLGRAAELGAKNSHRLQHMANSKLQEVDDSAVLEDEKSIAALKTVAVLTKMANDAAVIPSNLLAANKERVAKLDEPAPGEGPQTSGVLIVPGLSADAEAWAKLAQQSALKGGE